MSANHTPGPWAAIEIKGDPLRSFAIDAGVYLGSLAVWPVHSDEMQANARLIAAAPDMYTMLKRVRAAIARQDGFSSLNGFEDLIDQIIKKIEG